MTHCFGKRTRFGSDAKILATIFVGRCLRAHSWVPLLVLVMCSFLIESESFYSNLPCQPGRGMKPWSSTDVRGLRKRLGSDSWPHVALDAVQLRAADGSYSGGPNRMWGGKMKYKSEHRLGCQQIEEKLANQMIELCGKDMVDLGRHINMSQNGLILAGSGAYCAIDAYTGKESAIEGVPVDYRKSCQWKLRRHISAREQSPQPSMNLKKESRVSLLCNAASRGCGKSVLQAFNLNWFVEELHGGIGIETTFNDDQDSLWREVDDDKTMEVAVAIRALHRLVEYFQRIDGKGFELRTYKEIYRFDEFDARSPVGKRLIATVRQLSSPIMSAVRIIRKVVGAAENTKVFLAVDEIKSAPLHGSSYLPSKALSAICKAMDRDISQTLHISASVYGCNVLADFATDSGRGLLYQSLGPVLMEIDDEQVRMLPYILRPFFDANMREKLPFTPEYLSAYAKISSLLQEAAGHPRRLRNLLRSLRRCSYVLPKQFGKPEGWQFGREVLKFFGHQQLESLLFDMYIENAQVGELRIGPAGQNDTENLAKDFSCRFAFPVDSVAAATHRCLLGATETGHCQFIETDSIGSGKIYGYAYASLPALKEIKFASKRDSSKIGPNLDALQRLTDALSSYSTDVGKTGKPFESVVLHSVLSVARSNPSFNPSTWCQQHQCSFDSSDITGGGSVQLWDDIELFPDGADVCGHLQKLVDRLKTEGAVGAVFQPKDVYNQCGDVYGLFEDALSGGYLLLVMQCKDWFQNFVVDPKTREKVAIEAKWRSAQRKFRNAGEIKVKVGSKVVQVKPYYLLFSASDPGISVREGEGIVTTASMRNWLPSAAYAMQLAQMMNRAFSPSE
jgi:hypothetical protein